MAKPVFFEQMANIGAEIGRAINWRKRDKEISTASLYRGLELLDATIKDKKNKKSKLVELCRVREALADYFCLTTFTVQAMRSGTTTFTPSTTPQT